MALKLPFFALYDVRTICPLASKDAKGHFYTGKMGENQKKCIKTYCFFVGFFVHLYYMGMFFTVEKERVYDFESDFAKHY